MYNHLSFVVHFISTFSFVFQTDEWYQACRQCWKSNLGLNFVDLADMDAVSNLLNRGLGIFMRIFHLLDLL